MLPKTSDYVKGCSGQTKCMWILIEDDNLLERYNIIWDKVSTSSSQFTIKKFFNIRMKHYDDEATDFHYKEIPKASSNHTCLAAITIDSTV